MMTSWGSASDSSSLSRCEWQHGEEEGSSLAWKTARAACRPSTDPPFPGCVHPSRHRRLGTMRRDLVHPGPGTSQVELTEAAFIIGSQSSALRSRILSG